MSLPRTSRRVLYRHNTALSQCSPQPSPRLRQRLPLYLSLIQARRRNDTSFPPASRFQNKDRFLRYEDPSEEVLPTTLRNPLDYVNYERLLTQRQQLLKRRLFASCTATVLLVLAQIWIIFMYDDPETATSQKEREKRKRRIAEGTAASRDRSFGKERLDGPPKKDGVSLEGKTVLVKEKPGQPDIKLDAHGVELVETGTSTIPYFPRTISLPSSSASSSTPAAAASAEQVEEQYSLLGLGVRTVSFLSIEVYVLGLYVRTSDLPRLQSAFVKHVNSIGTSLIPSEKEMLKQDLLDSEKSLKIWDRVLRDASVRSAVRIVPTRNTDFGHLRDGWVTGITSRTREISKIGGNGVNEYNDENFGEAMKRFKAVFGGRGSAPWGSTLFLIRDEKGLLSVLYDSESKTNQWKVPLSQPQQKAQHIREMLGQIEDERISRQVWLGYLAGKKVSSEGARKSVVDGVMELVERPVGTVGMQVT